jgi:hypothetical protein
MTTTTRANGDYYVFWVDTGIWSMSTYATEQDALDAATIAKRPADVHLKMVRKFAEYRPQKAA